jgi:hypothetical protein
MPFVVPNLSDAFASRSGTTAIGGSLTPTQSGSVSRIGATLAAYTPAGAITSTTCWGFMAGGAPRGARSLAVAASGTTFERAATLTYGGYSAAHAEISITVEEFEPVERVSSRLIDLDALDPGDGPAEFLPVPGRPLGSLVFSRSVTSGPTTIIHIWSAVFGIQVHHGTPPRRPSS